MANELVGQAVEEGWSYQRLAEAFDEFGAALDEHLGILTNDVLDLQFDGRRKRGRVRLRGETSRVAIGLDSRVSWERGGAHVRDGIGTRIDQFAVIGPALRLDDVIGKVGSNDRRGADREHGQQLPAAFDLLLSRTGASFLGLIHGEIQ